MRSAMRVALSSLLLCGSLPLFGLLLGCGSSASPSFTLQVSPGAVALQNWGSSQPLTVTVVPAGGFTGAVSVALTGLPSNVTASPATVTVTPGQLAQFELAAKGAAVASDTPMQLTATSGALASTGTAALTVTEALSNASLSASTFSFGGVFAGTSLSKTVTTVTNTGKGSVTLSPSVSGDAGFALAATQGCSASLAPGAKCAVSVTYAPTAPSGGTAVTAKLTLGLGNVPGGTAQTVTLHGTSAVLPQGTVAATANPLVALYSLTLPFAGTMTVNFGTDTTYGRHTWTQSTSTNNQTMSILVAGMPQKSTYHLQAAVTLPNGLQANDVDHTFTNGASEVQPNLTASTTPGMTPQPGVEQLTFVNGSLGIAVTDLSGAVLWSYQPPEDAGGYAVEGAKLLQNGDFLLTIGEGSSYGINGALPAPGAITALREVDLAGDIVRELSVTDLTNELKAAGYNIALQQFHHDVTPLPNGHWLVLSNTLAPFTDLPGYPGVTNVLGDVVIDVDQDLQPVWVWNSFDHLDVNRHPWNFPDWTHTNALVYSPSDGNLIVSMRHQNWVLKLDYENGKGSGNVLWHLGQGGDFALENGTDPTDWNYAQHYPSLFSPNSSGVFSMGLMDNGDDRVFPSGVTCGASGSPPCLYTTIPVFQIDEGAKTATLTFHQILNPSLYSSFGGNTELLDNGDIEYDLAGVGGNSDIFEVTPVAGAPETVWHMHSEGGNAYRGYRIPSLYPGVQW